MIALALLAAFLLLGAGLLVSALRFFVAVSERGAAFEFGWGLVTVGMDTVAREFRLGLLGWTVVRRDLDREDKEEKKPRKAKKPRRPRRRLSPRRLLAQRRAILELVRFFWSRLHWDRFRARLTLATPDPALTGELFGYLSAVTGALKATLPAGTLVVSPDFMAQWPTGEAEIGLRIRVYVLVVVAWRAFRISRRVMRPR